MILRLPCPGQKAQRAVLAPAGHQSKTWMAGHQGVYARLRWLSPAMTEREPYFMLPTASSTALL